MIFSPLDFSETKQQCQQRPEKSSLYSFTKELPNVKKQPRCSIKKVFFKVSQNSQENTCARVSFSSSCSPKPCNNFKKEDLTQVFSCEFWEISKNTFLTEHLRTTASEYQS